MDNMNHKDANEDDRSIIGYVNGQPFYRQTGMVWFETQSVDDFFKEESSSD